MLWPHPDALNQKSGKSNSNRALLESSSDDLSEWAKLRSLRKKAQERLRPWIGRGIIGEERKPKEMNGLGTRNRENDQLFCELAEVKIPKGLSHNGGQNELGTIRGHLRNEVEDKNICGSISERYKDKQKQSIIKIMQSNASRKFKA